MKCCQQSALHLSDPSSSVKWKDFSFFFFFLTQQKRKENQENVSHGNSSQVS